MSLPLTTIKRLLPPGLKVHGREGLLFQRLFWGAMAGCLTTLLWAESPVLESMEVNTLEWRYRIANHISSWMHPPAVSKEISIVSFDDDSQFDLSITRFNEPKAQACLAEAISKIEKGGPTMVVVDLDLQGTTPPLRDVMQRYGNVVVAFFGGFNSDDQSLGFLLDAAAYGYDELPRESNGLECQLPINYRGAESNPEAFDAAGFAPVPSLTEAVIDLHRKIKGVGPKSQYFAMRSDQPLYISFRHVQFPTVSLAHVVDGDARQCEQFRDRIVLIGANLTQRYNDATKHRTPLQESVPDIEVHANAIATLLDNQVIYSCPSWIAHHLLLLLGAAFGAIASILPLGLRTAACLCTGMTLVALSQIAFQMFHLNLPVAPPLAVLTLGFSLGTFIYLDTDLRQRNRELAEARESMQVRAEEERQRIAEDLHDETLPALSSVARMADRLAQDLGDNPVPSQMREKLDHAVMEMRRVINDLHPSVLETMGFKPALENLVSMLSRETGIESNYSDGDGQDDYGFSNFTKLQLYRIVQEGLNNVQKHSSAKLVELCIAQNDGQLVISVLDDGRGIDPRAIRPDSHGLVNIRQRAQLIGAQVEWRKPEKFAHGTELRLKIAMADEPNNG